MLCDCQRRRPTATCHIASIGGWPACVCMTRVSVVFAFFYTYCPFCPLLCSCLAGRYFSMCWINQHYITAGFGHCSPRLCCASATKSFQISFLLHKTVKTLVLCRHTQHVTHLTSYFSAPIDVAPYFFFFFTRFPTTCLQFFKYFQINFFSS